MAVGVPRRHLFNTAYAFGLRRNETRMLDVVDFSANPHGQEFGAYGVLDVRFGKVKKNHCQTPQRSGRGRPR